MSAKADAHLIRTAMYVLLGLGIIVSVYPFYWMFTASTLLEEDIFKVPLRGIPDGQFLANLQVLEQAMPIWKALFNSI